MKEINMEIKVGNKPLTILTDQNNLEILKSISLCLTVKKMNSEGIIHIIDFFLNDFN